MSTLKTAFIVSGIGDSFIAFVIPSLNNTPIGLLGINAGRYTKRMQANQQSVYIDTGASA